MGTVLIIDDDKDLCELLSDYFKPEGFEVDSVHNGLEGAERAVSGKYSMIVLDVMLPGVNGFEVLRRIRSTSRIPVLMLTARGDDVDRIVGLEIGADDYLPKPFNPRELVARIRAVLRRVETSPQLPAQADQGRLVVGDIELVAGTRTVLRSGRKIDLTTVEFAILETMLNRAGQVVSRDDLVKQALGRNLSSYDRSIDVHVSSLRKKLGPLADASERIKTIRSIGYLYSSEMQGAL